MSIRTTSLLHRCLPALAGRFRLLMLPALALAQDTPVPDKGDTAWLLTCAAIVIFMTLPGLALFYGGLVRSKNVLSVLMQCLLVFSLVAVLWALYGYSFAFTEGGPFFGGLDRLWAKGLDTTALAATFTKGVYVPELAFFVFQGAFACITCALIVGAFAERIKFSRGAPVHGDLVHLRLHADGAHGVVLPRPGCLHRQRRGGRRAGAARASCSPRARWISPAARWCTSTPRSPGWWVRT